jgi:hypothetical protein
LHRLEENLGATSVELSDRDLRAIAAVSSRSRSKASDILPRCKRAWDGRRQASRWHQRMTLYVEVL